MILRLLSCAAVFSAWAALPLHASVEAMAWQALFSGQDVPASATPVEDGRHFITIAIPGADPASGRLRGPGDNSKVEVLTDPVSRLVVIRRDGPAVPVITVRPATPLGGGFPLRCPGGCRGATVEWVKKIDGRILPLLLLKIRYESEPPAPGTPLLDGEGRIAAMAYLPAGGQDGYALPAEVLTHVIAAVQRDGTVEKARLGLTLLPSEAQPRIARILPDSPASRAGLRQGDVLSSIGARKVEDYAEAVNAFYFLRPHATVSFRLMRDGKEMSITLTPDVLASR